MPTRSGAPPFQSRGTGVVPRRVGCQPEGVEAREYPGSAVLVHGTWGNPHDWRWVSALLRDAGVAVSVPDLPSHRDPGAGLTADAEEVRRAALACTPPIVLVGWSY